MVFKGILPEVPSFGTAFARGLGGGISQGISKANELAREMAFEKEKQDQFQKLYQEIKKNRGQTQLPNQSDGGISQQQPTDPYEEAEMWAASGHPEMARIATKRASEEGRAALAREKMGESQLLESGERIKNLENTGMRFERLAELFSPENEKKFPPAILAGLFSSSGEISPKMMGLLSPEAQESIKLVADELSGAKDSFGARVTNFDLQSYMKRLPTLLNTAEGRRRVLRDLRMMNQLNLMYEQGVMDIVDQHGGPGRISISKARNIFNKEFAPQRKMIQEEFVNPGSHAFEFPQFYKGRKLKDEETGQILISDGKQWIPEE